MRCSELLRASRPCFRRRLSAHHAGAAPPPQSLSLGSFGDCYAPPVNERMKAVHSPIDRH